MDHVPTEMFGIEHPHRIYPLIDRTHIRRVLAIRDPLQRVADEYAVEVEFADRAFGGELIANQMPSLRHRLTK